MSLSPKTPMALYKANLEFVLRIGTLLQENRQRCMQAGAAGTSEAIQRTLAETERMLTTNDWSALSKMPGEEFWKSLRGEVAPLHSTVESAVRSQTEFAEGLKQAFAQWQQQTTEALGGNTVQAAPWALSDLMQAFNPPGRSDGATSRDKAAETKKPKAKKSPAKKAKSSSSRAPKSAVKAKAKAPSKKKAGSTRQAKPARK